MLGRNTTNHSNLLVTPGAAQFHLTVISYLGIAVMFVSGSSFKGEILTMGFLAWNAPADYYCDHQHP